jgi:hypothetical protein
MILLHSLICYECKDKLHQFHHTTTTATLSEPKLDAPILSILFILGSCKTLSMHDLILYDLAQTLGSELRLLQHYSNDSHCCYSNLQHYKTNACCFIV